MDEDQKPSRPDVIATTVQNLHSMLIHTNTDRPAHMSMCVHHDYNTFACILATKLQFANHIFNIAELSLILAFAIKS